MFRIEADLLIPGQGDPIRDAAVILDGSRILYAGPAAVAPPPASPADASVVRAVTVMPGMWDCHGHFIGTRTFDLNQLPLDADPLADIGVLADPDHVTAVWSLGRLVKGATV